MLYPIPKKADLTGEIGLPEKYTLRFSCEGPLGGEKFRIVFGECADGGDLTVEIKARYAAPDGNENDEAFTLDVSETETGISAEIFCLTDAALVRALFRIKAMLDGKTLPLGRISDWPSFACRGYIEGFYGKPWSHSQRLDMMRFMASKGENCVYYAPKDDPYHRRLWRELYPADELNKLKELAGKAEDLCMRLAYCLAPGLSIRYTDEKDVSALYEKLRQVYSVGIKSFGLLLDDIPEGFTCEADENRYPDFVSAHIDLVNGCYDFLKTLDKDCTLTVCPTVYWGRGDDDYDVRLGNGIPEDVLLFFTGRDICSREITCGEADYIKEKTGHAPLYWDNFPVNDAEMFKEMHLAPVNGREALLYRSCAGVISNGMEYFECTKFPFSTVADYLWAPESYDPELSFDAALKNLLPADEAEDMRLLADHLRTSCLRDENSRIMGAYLSKATAFLASGEPGKAIPPAEKYTRMVNNAKNNLEKSDRIVYKELGEWIGKFSQMCDILSDALIILGKEAEDIPAAKACLAEKMAAYNDRATVLTAFCFREFIETVLLREI